MWTVKIKRRMERSISSLPDDVQSLYVMLKADLTSDGPEQKSWKNYSKLGANRYHCHLNYHYVACWTVLDNEEMILEVYYVGSRENAPY
ncbi:MAG: hypothetical protein PHI85_05135 [Victivallaceae bacterium]|nr:hypothetical protein [Victivallaceae bacterium]